MESNIRMVLLEIEKSWFIKDILFQSLITYNIKGDYK
jgi:hypothetical protein